MTDPTTLAPLTDDILAAARNLVDGDLPEGPGAIQAAVEIAEDLLAEVDRLRAQLAEARAEVDRQRHEREKYTERWGALDLQRLAALELHRVPFCETCNSEGPCETRRALDGDGVTADTETREQLWALVDRHGMADRTCLIGDDTTE